MKILIVNDTISFIGGAETYLHNLSKALNEKGHEIITLSEKPNKEEIFPYIKKQYFSKTYPDEKFNCPISRYWNVYAKKKIREVIKSENPEVVHFHNVFSRLSPVAISEATKYKPTILTVHDTRFDWPKFMYLDKNFDIYPGTFGFKCLFNGEVNPFMFLYQYTRNFLYRKALNKVNAIITLNNFVKNA
ncbi:MAG: glycosyltransferase family 4 protein [Candidatus Pacearchaeota archaeon]